MGDIFNIIIIHPITNLLVAFYELLLFLHVPYPLGFAIIVLTVFTRILLWPFLATQIKSAHKMQKVAPHIAHVKEKHKDDKKRQQEEMMKVYKEHGVNPAAGCLPLLIQIPITLGLYNVLSHSITLTDKIKIADIVHRLNDVLYFPFLKIDIHTWNTSFFGLSLVESPQKFFSHNPLVILIPLLTAALQFVLSKMMLPEDAPKQKKDDFQSAFQTQSLFIFPVMIGYFSFVLPLGMSLYWNTFTIFGILQQYLLVGPGGAKGIFERILKQKLQWQKQ